VERPSQLAFLREQGCASFQGFLACPPMPVAGFENWLAKQAAPRKDAPGKAPEGKKSARKPAAKKPAAKKPRATRK
jgi:hypothetical protein